MSMPNDLLVEVLMDSELKEEFIKNPKKVLADRGIKVDEKADYRVLVDSPNLKHIVLPYLEAKKVESGEELESRKAEIILPP